MASPTDIPLNTLAIHNTLSRYVGALDIKDFDLLDKVFSKDVVADYPFNANLNGVDQIRDAIRNRLGPILTHHNLTTQTIVFSPSGTTAYTTTHFIGSHFGQGPHEGKVLTAYGRYIDELECVKAGKEEVAVEGVPGASGLWRIKKRTVAFTKRVGDEKVMEEF